MIYQHQWYTKEEIIKNRLKYILGKREKVFARTCEIKKISFLESKDFLNKHHLQGCCMSSIQYGLFNNNELISVMTFGKSRFTFDEYELIRYASSKSVIGGASKLFSYFLKEISPNIVLSYADLDWSNGNLYEKIGFKKEGYTHPSYVWVKGKEVISRYKTQIKNENTTMRNMGYIKIYKCGNIKYLWKKI